MRISVFNTEYDVATGPCDVPSDDFCAEMFYGTMQFVGISSVSEEKALDALVNKLVKHLRMISPPGTTISTDDIKVIR